MARFFEPRALADLSRRELEAYSEHCEQQLRRIERDYAYLDGHRAGLSNGFRADGILTFAGLAISAASLPGVAVFTFMGFLTLAGGALSIVGVQRYADRYIERSLLIDQVRSRRASIEFLARELGRVGEELSRRGIK
jgi:hypothetical protein